jgi:hypothetical protein
MANADQIRNAWRHLWEDPNGIKVRRRGGADTWIVLQKTTATGRATALLVTPGTYGEARQRLADLGWQPSSAGARMSASTFHLSDAIEHREDAAQLFELAARTLAITTAAPTSTVDLRVTLLDIGSDAGWAQAGCLLAAPGMLIGAAVGFLAALKLAISLAGLGVLAGLLIGGSIAYLSGGFVAVGALRLGGLVPAVRPWKGGLSYVGWFVGSVIGGLLLIVAYDAVSP